MTIDTNNIEFTILIPAFGIKMTSVLSKEDALMILKKTVIAISLTKHECEDSSVDDLLDFEIDDF